MTSRNVSALIGPSDALFTTVTSGISARPLEATLMSSGSTLSRMVRRLARITEKTFESERDGCVKVTRRERRLDGSAEKTYENE